MTIKVDPVAGVAIQVSNLESMPLQIDPVAEDASPVPESECMPLASIVLQNDPVASDPITGAANAFQFQQSRVIHIFVPHGSVLKKLTSKLRSIQAITLTLGAVGEDY